MPRHAASSPGMSGAPTPNAAASSASRQPPSASTTPASTGPAHQPGQAGHLQRPVHRLLAGGERLRGGRAASSAAFASSSGVHRTLMPEPARRRHRHAEPAARQRQRRARRRASGRAPTPAGRRAARRRPPRSARRTSTAAAAPTGRAPAGPAPARSPGHRSAIDATRPSHTSPVAPRPCSRSRTGSPPPCRAMNTSRHDPAAPGGRMALMSADTDADRRPGHLPDRRAPRRVRPAARGVRGRLDGRAGRRRRGRPARGSGACCGTPRSRRSCATRPSFSSHARRHADLRPADETRSRSSGR